MKSKDTRLTRNHTRKRLNLPTESHLLCSFCSLFSKFQPLVNFHTQISCHLTHASLIHIPGGIIINSQHWQQTVASAVSSGNVTSSRPNIMNRQTDAASSFTDQSALFQSIINTFNRVVFHVQQETT